MPSPSETPLALAFLAQRSGSPAGLPVGTDEVLREMIALSHSYHHGLAIYAFNVATTMDEARAAVAQFYDLGDFLSTEPPHEAL
jgi:hypothetical protein